MKKLLCFAGICSVLFIGYLATAYASLTDENPFFTSHPREMKILYPYSAFFRIQSEYGAELGTVTKHRNRMQQRIYRYYGMKNDQDLLATARVEFNGLGQLFTWASGLEICNGKKEKMGSIQGTWMTFSPSYFYFYDAEGRLLGTADMDANGMGYSVYSACDNLTVAKFTRINVPGRNDYWYVTIYDNNEIPPAMLILFGAFVVENQGEFRIDN